MKESAVRPAIVDGLLASWTRGMTRSPTQDALILSSRPGIINLSLGLPDPELFPRQLFAKASLEVLSQGSAALQYGPPSAVLKSHVVSLMRARGVECQEKHIFLTIGAQQALYLIVAMLLDPGRQIIAEEFCYPGFRQVVEFYKPQLLTVPTAPGDGMDIDKIEWYLVQGVRPAFIYAIPDGHNPLGVSLSAEKRARLVSLSQRYYVPIVEEDPYGFLSYGLRTREPLRAQNPDLVFYIGSFSKILAPSIRIGWLVVPEHLVPHLAILKESFDIDMATLAQHVVACMLDSGFLAGHLDLLCSEYKNRRDTMLRAISQQFPAGSAWIYPESGVFLWVRLPEEFDTTQLLKIAVEEYGIAFMPGPSFSTDRDARSGRSSLRLNFSHSSPTRIQEGILRFGELLKSRKSVCAKTGVGSNQNPRVRVPGSNILTKLPNVRKR